MKRLSCIAVAIALTASLVQAEEFKSGLQPGKFVGAYDVTKIAGAEDDGVEIGKNLCYRCKNGGRPQAMIFIRATDGQVATLVKKLDASLEKHADKELRAFVNVLADSKDAASEQAKKLAESAGTKNVPYVVPNEFENGPEDYGINTKADVTIILAKGGKVTANFSAADAKDLKVDDVLAGVEKLLEE